MLSLFYSKHTPSHIEKYPELQEALQLIKKLHQKAETLKRSSSFKNPNSIERRKFDILNQLLIQVDKEIQDFNDINTSEDEDDKNELINLLKLIQNLFNIIASRVNDYTLFLSRNKNRERAGKVVYGSTFLSTFAVGSNLFFTPLGLATAFYIAQQLSDQAKEISGLKDTSPESMRILKQLHKSLAKLNIQFTNKNIIKNKPECENETEDFICPITLEIMTNPVVCTLDQITYDKPAIEKWLAMKRSSPIDRTKKIPPGKSIQDVLIPNYPLKSMIEKYNQKHSISVETGSIIPQACV